jgi:hypothetical protein
MVDFRSRFPFLADLIVRVLSPVFVAKSRIELPRALLGKMGSETIFSVSWGR